MDRRESIDIDFDNEIEPVIIKEILDDNKRIFNKTFLRKNSNFLEQYIKKWKIKHNLGQEMEYKMALKKSPYCLFFTEYRKFPMFNALFISFFVYFAKTKSKI